MQIRNHRNINLSTIKIMSKNLSYLIMGLVSSLFLFSCQKYPSASFTANKQEFNAGETISLTNLSLDADSYEWTFPNGEKSTEKTVSYVIPDNTPSGLYPIQLKAISKNKKKIDIQTLYVSINEISQSGAVMFWLYYNNNAGVSSAVVNIQGTTKYISDYKFSTPSCDDSYCANFYSLLPGTYSYYASSGGYSWSGSFTIPNNPSTCTKVQLF